MSVKDGVDARVREKERTGEEGRSARQARYTREERTHHLIEEVGREKKRTDEPMSSLRKITNNTITYHNRQ